MDSKVKGNVLKKLAAILCVLLVILSIGGTGFVSAVESTENSSEITASEQEETKEAESSTQEEGSGETPPEEPAEKNNAESLAAADGEDNVSSAADEQAEEPDTEPAAPEQEETVYQPGMLEYEGKDYTVKLTYEADAKIPQGASLTVKEIEKETKKFDKYLAKSGTALREEGLANGNLENVDARFFDITIKDGERKIEPEGTVSVDISCQDALPLAENGEVNAVHFESRGTEVLKTDTEEKDGEISRVSFDTESFSVFGIVYTVDFSYEVDGTVFQYSIEGGSSVALSSLIDSLRINSSALSTEEFIGQIEKVVFSSPDLLEVEKSENDWILKSLQSFDTKEKLTVTMKDGQEFTIEVTDAERPKIIVDVKDVSGNTVTDLGKGFTLTYYELPQSRYQEITSQSMPSPNDYSDTAAYYAALREAISSRMAELDKCKKTVTVTGSGQELGSLVMESDASADNPYIIMFMTGMNPDIPDDDTLNMLPFVSGFPFGTAAAEYTGQFSLTYDGDTVTDKTNMTEDSDRNLHGTIYKDSSLTSVTEKISMNASDYTAGMLSEDPDAYPVYAKALLMSPAITMVTGINGNAQPRMTGYTAQTVTTKVTADGDVTFAFKKKISTLIASNAQGAPAPILMIGFYSDEACTQAVTDWNMASDYGTAYQNHTSQESIPSGMHGFTVSVQPDGSLRLMDNSQTPYTVSETVCEPEFVKGADLFTPSLDLGFIDEGGFSDENDFPLYALVTLTAEDENGGTVTTKKVMEIPAVNEAGSAGGVKDPYQVTFDRRMSKTDTFHASVKLYRDEACTQETDSWQNGELSYLHYDEEKDALTDGSGTPQLICTYWLTDLQFNCETYTYAPDEDYPSYVKFTITTYEYDEDYNEVPVEHTVIKPFTENGVQTIDFKDLDRGGYGSAKIQYAVYSDEACENLHGFWNSTTTIEGYIRSDGVFWSYNDDKAFDTIAFSHVASDKIVVQMDAETGSVPQDAAFPVYIRATLTGPDNTPVTTVKQINDAASADTELVFEAAEGESFLSSTGDAYTVTFECFSDAACTEKSSIWSSGSFQADLTKNKTLTHDGDTAGIHFRQLTLTVDPEAYELTVDAEHPIYVRVIAERSDGTTFMWKGERTDLEAFTAECSCIGYATPFSTDVRSGEHWTVTADVCTDESCETPHEEWTSDSEEAIVTLSDGLQTEEEKATATMDSWGGTQMVYTYEYKNTVLLPEYVRGGVTAALPVHVNVPEGVEDPYYWHAAAGPDRNPESYLGKANDAVHIRLFKNGIDGYEMVWKDDKEESYGDSNHFVDVKELDGENKLSFPMGTLTPGTYYITWFMGANNAYYKADPSWVEQTDAVTIIVKEDGTIVDENGNPYTAEVYYKEDYKKNLVQPKIQIHSTFPEEHMDDVFNVEGQTVDGKRNGYTDKYNPRSFQFTMKPKWENASADFSVDKAISIFITDREYRFPIIEEGTTYIGSYPEFARNMWWWGNEYYRTSSYRPNEHNKTVNYLHSSRMSWGSSYPLSENVGWPTDWYMPWHNAEYYEHELFVGYPEGEYEVSYYVNDYKTYWHQETATVTLKSDGKLYREDGTEFIIELYMLEEQEVSADSAHEKLQVSVETSIEEGISKEEALKETDTYWVGLYENGNETPVAYGQVKITDTGTTTVELKSPGGSPVELFNDKSYHLEAGMATRFDENGLPTGFSNLWRYSQYWFSDYRGNHIMERITDEGVILSYPSSEDETAGDPLILPNECLIVPWKTVDPKSISQPEEGGLVFKPVKDYAQIQDKGHYIIVVQNQFNKKWYALTFDEENGYQTELADVSSLDDLKNGYRFDENSDNGGIILTAGKVKKAEESVSLQLKSGAKDAETGKALALKMGTSKAELYPMYSTSAGTVMISNIMAEDADAPTFQITKGNYAFLNYVHEIFGQSGFGTIQSSSDYYYYYPAVQVVTDDDGKQYYMVSENYLYQDPNYHYYSTATRNGYVGQKPANDTGSYYDQTYLFLPDREGYTTDEYMNSYAEYLSGMASSGYMYLPANPYSSDTSYAPDSMNFYILTDVEEPTPSEDNNTYTLVKTFGDFYNTFVNQGGSSATMLLAYKDQDGKEYVLNPKGAVEVKSKEASNGYNRIVVGAENELIPNNNSGTSETFGFELADVLGSGEQVFSNSFALRKSRQNTAADMNYVTLNGADGDSAWAKNDDSEHGDGLVYVMEPTNRVMSQSDWDTVETYKLRVIRYGESGWLALKTDEDGKQKMVITHNEEEALELYVYAPVLTRYYSSAYGSDFYKYYKIHSLEEINAGDELLIVYNDGEKRHLAAYSLAETSGRASAEYGWSSPFAYPALEILDSYSTFNTQQDDVPEDVRYKYRLDTDGQEKKPYAYFDAENEEMIWAQGIASNAVGTAKKETKTQRKYESVTPLGNQLLHLYLKTEKYPLYHSKKGEVSFLDGDSEGQFVLRGGKSDAWMATTSYTKSELNLATGRYEDSKQVLSFDTISSPDGSLATQFEIYRKSNTDATFRIEYYDTEKELDKAVIRPQESVTLLQKDDLHTNNTDYIFVGWTPDPKKAALLPLEDSANLFDYDDVANRAAVKADILEKYSLLGDCDPSADNIVSYDDISPYVEEGVLKLYPVYAVRGYSQVVTADEEDGTKIVGISDFKDQQMGGDGNPEARERWLGSVNIEVYKDGELWVPENGDGVATMYFAYHNDNAADLNIKFIADTVTAETLNDYLSDSDTKSFTTTEPTEHYVIDAVYAEQGGSEDGLKYRYNWIDQETGGQLDNVKGGSTVKIYVTSKYQVKYYLDKGDGNGYQELVSPQTDKTTWTNPKYYTTAGTENVVNAIDSTVGYKVTKDSEYTKLLDLDTTDGSTFTDENMTRGDYSKFLYKFDEYEHTIPIAVLPGAEETGDAELDEAGTKGNWVIRNADLEELTTQKASTQDQAQTLTVTDTSYGTGNSKWSYKGSGDSAYTYHLYAKVITDETAEIIITKIDGAGNGTKGLSGAVFQMKSVNGDNETLAADIDGVTGLKTVTKMVGGEEKSFESAFETTGEGQTISGLPNGTYRLYEVCVPAGYTNTLPYIEFSVADGVVTMTTTDDNLSFTEADDEDSAQLKITNMPGQVLPNTGGIGVQTFILLGSLLLTAAGALFVVIRVIKRRS